MRMNPKMSERLRELFYYEPETGIFTWRVSPNRRIRIGSAAGHTHRVQGYVNIFVDGCVYRAHRLAWLWMTGDWPAGGLDHINTNRSDNRFSNLRLATLTQNAANAHISTNNRSGFKGIDGKCRDKWRAGITINHKKIFLGYFSTREEAHAAYCAAARAAFGEHART